MLSFREFLPLSGDRNQPGVVSYTGTFGRMFPNLPPLVVSREALASLAAEMVELEPSGKQQDNKAIAAGYTYLGQFIDHDITFDPTPLADGSVDVYSLTNFRTPKLDLDCMYGPGPNLAPYLYRKSEESLDGAPPIRFRYHLLLGKVTFSGNSRLPELPNDSDFDLLRLEDGTPVIPDFRDDENLLVSQMHVLFARFHNKVVDLFIPPMKKDPLSPVSRSRLAFRLQKPSEPKAPPPSLSSAEAAASFDEIRQFVLWHYQWIVLHDFLPQVVDRAVLKEVLDNGPKFYRPSESPFMPVEFSGAAYRFGHSLVRESYNLNGLLRRMRPREGGLVALERLFAFDRPLPDELVVDWRRFFPRPEIFAEELNLSRKINPYFAPGLHHLRIPGPTPKLTERNLLRGRMLGLPSGQDVARAMGLEPLTPDQISQTPTDGKVAKDHGLHVATPLWYYILKEAQIKNEGRWLGPVGSRIVAEVLVGLVLADKSSYLNRNPNWVPEPPIARSRGELRMADIVNFTGTFEPLRVM